MSKAKYCHFKPEWLHNEKYSKWIQPSKSTNKKARCSLCEVEFDIANMGVSALDSHAAGKKHKSRVQTSSSAGLFFQSKFIKI